jgi:AraC-like DNA-binding protein
MDNQIVQLNCICDYNRMHGFETFHPLVTVVDLSKATKSAPQVKINYGLYALFLKNGTGCSIRYGRQFYDYQAGTIVSFAPGQVVEVVPNKPDDNILPDVQGLLFHPDLIYGTSLGRKISQYTFFSYDQKEALHLSERERVLILEIFRQIQSEIEHPVDKHSQELITVSIELLLDYCLRFYDRQFITRSKVNSDILGKFESNLNDYFQNGESERKGLPSVKYFADKVFLSSGYFGDLIKKETGITAQKYIQNKVIELSKSFILNSEMNINEIAYKLGFQYPQHLSRLFKQQVGCSPSDFKKSDPFSPE